MRYSPGSLVVVVSASDAEREAFINRVIEEKGAIFTLAKVRGLIEGRVPAEELDERAAELQQAAVTKRLEAGETVVVGAEGLGAEERDRWARIAHGFRRPRHVILLETAKDQVGEEDALPLNELRTALDSGELGAEGFQTAMRLGGASIGELKRIVFRSPPRDD
jgi:predicted kinase